MISKENISILDNLIKTTSSMIEWSGKNLKSSEQIETFKQLVAGRRNMKRIKNALDCTPTVAAFGESQQGKSYIISSLLSTPGKPLRVTNDKGEMVNFIENFNYQTDKTESTGVVTRFTTQQFGIDSAHPVKLSLFSPADLVIMLANSFMIDIKGYSPYRIDDLKKLASDLSERYDNSPIVQDILTEDEIGDIEQYLSKHNGKDIQIYKDAGYFDRLSLIIRRVPVSQWGKVFEPLWKGDHANNVLTELFNRFVVLLEELNFSKEVFISTKVVQNDFNDGWVTLMSVKILKDHLVEFFESPNDGVLVEVQLQDGGIRSVHKSALGLLAAEAVYHVDASMMDDVLSFDSTGIRKSVFSELSKGSPRTAEDNKQHMHSLGLYEVTSDSDPNKVTRSFLKAGEESHFDLLDFPGARGREEGIDIKSIKLKLADLMLRCKVAYLFNKYSEEQRLSILLLCHSGENSTPNLIAPMLNEWVNAYIGETPDERMATIRDYEIAPLFLISTMFNKNLAVAKKSTGELNFNREIFTQRFGTILYGEIINIQYKDWFEDFLPNHQRFDNTYVLRDYYYSSNSNGCSGVFEGYPGKEVIERDEEERAQIKTLFLQDPNVRKFFPDPELAWNVAATLNNDGTYYMIKRLGIAAKNAVKARNMKFTRDLSGALKTVLDAIEPKYHNQSDNEKLQESINMSKRFNLAVRMASEQNEDFFGRFIQFLQMTPNYVSSEFAKIVHSTCIPDSSVVRRYELISDGVKMAGEHFVPDDDEENYNVLMRVFGAKPDDPLLKGLDMKALFSTSFLENCSPSHILSKHLVDDWHIQILAPSQSIVFTQMGFNSTVLSAFLSNFDKMARFVDIRSHIADAIAEYVDFTAAIDERNLSLISDVAANIYNSFVMDLGYSYLSDEVLEDVRSHNEKYNLRFTFNYEQNDQEGISDEEAMESLFKSLEELGNGIGGQMLKLPSYLNMCSWIEKVGISYIATFKNEDFDLEANNKLGSLIVTFKENQKQATL